MEEQSVTTLVNTPRLGHLIAAAFAAVAGAGELRTPIEQLSHTANNHW